MNVQNDTIHRVSSLHKTTGYQQIKRVDVNTERGNNTMQQSTLNQEMETNNKQDKEAVKSTVDKLNNFNDPVYTNLNFVFHDDLEKYYVEVVNLDTGEVIREIPPEKMLNMYAELAEYMGLLVDEKV